MPWGSSLYFVKVLLISLSIDDRVVCPCLDNGLCPTSDMWYHVLDSVLFSANVLSSVRWHCSQNSRASLIWKRHGISDFLKHFGNEILTKFFTLLVPQGVFWFSSFFMKADGCSVFCRISLSWSVRFFNLSVENLKAKVENLLSNSTESIKDYKTKNSCVDTKMLQENGKDFRKGRWNMFWRASVRPSLTESMIRLIRVTFCQKSYFQLQYRVLQVKKEASRIGKTYASNDMHKELREQFNFLGKYQQSEYCLFLVEVESNFKKSNDYHKRKMMIENVKKMLMKCNNPRILTKLRIIGMLWHVLVRFAPQS